MTSTRSLLVLLAAAPLLAAGAAQAQPTVVAGEVEGAATVESVDQSAREVLLSTPDQLFTLKVSPEVHNLAQVHAGDRVRVVYHASLAAQIAKPGTPAVSAQDFRARAPLGARPAGVVARTVTARVKVNGVDTAANTVTITGPAGRTQKIAVQDPAMRRFAATLRQGDEVDITYTEAVAVRVTPQ